MNASARQYFKLLPGYEVAVAQISKSAVSQVSKPAGCQPTATAADLEIGDTFPIRNRDATGLPRTKARLAFSLLELLVALATVGLLLFIFIPGMAKSGLSSKGFQCLNNTRQLCNAWRMYADENSDRLVFASQDPGDPSLPPPGSAYWDKFAWANDLMDFNPYNRGNWDTNYDMVLRPLWPFTGRNANVYRCPSDPTYVRVAGIPTRRVRGMSMNLFVGGFDGTFSGWTQLNIYRLFLKSPDLTEPGPSKTFVFHDERPDYINWGNYMADMSGYPNRPGLYQFSGDVPGMFHNGGGSFSFADGSAEIHRWVDPRTTPPFSDQPPGLIAAPNDPDVAWLQSHSTSLK
jgi:prepilin-type processing-associated H-X9-DG protein